MEQTKNNKESKIINNDFNDKSFKVYWTWYLFLISNVLVIIGAAVYLIVYFKHSPSADLSNTWLITVVFNLVSIVCMVFFSYYEIKEIAPLRVHTQWKWYKFIFASLSSYTLMQLFCVVYLIATNGMNQRWIPIALIAILMLWVLATIILYKYGRFHIDQDIYRRRHGISINEKNKQDKIRKQQRQKVDKATNEEFKKMRELIDKEDTKNDLNNTKATSGLFDQMEKDE